jgi:hypothetical protein
VVAYFGSKKMARMAPPPMFSVACSSVGLHIEAPAGNFA